MIHFLVEAEKLRMFQNTEPARDPYNGCNIVKINLRKKRSLE